MNKKHLKGWIKHGDFIVLDLLVLQVSFMLAYWAYHGGGSPYHAASYQFQAVVLLLCQLLVILFTNGYTGILRRKRFDELLAVGKYMIWILLLAFAYLFVTQQTSTVSRMQFGLTAVFFVVLDFAVRWLNKQRIYKYSNGDENKKSIVLFTAEALVEEAMGKLDNTGIYQDYFVSAIVLLSGDGGSLTKDYGVPVEPLSDAVVTRISHGWVDEAFILQPEALPFPTKLMDQLMEMGITVNYSMSALSDGRWPVTDMRKLGGYKVLTSSIRFASAGQLALKRLMDIVGGLVGCAITGLLWLFLGPAIYAADPGPVFFAQERVGLNGKPFKMYKFRSMYMDAEERKAALMAQNKVQDGMMFKIDDDPRIIGSEKKDKKGRPRGIGNFIRNTSLDGSVIIRQTRKKPLLARVSPVLSKLNLPSLMVFHPCWGTAITT